MDRKEKFNGMCKRIKQLNDFGISQDAIVKVINDLELPIDIHMTLMGSLSDIMRYGRPLTKAERKLFR